MNRRPFILRALSARRIQLRRSALRYALAVIAGTALFTSGGCHRSIEVVQLRTEQNAPFIVFAIEDTSISNRKLLPLEVAELGCLTLLLNPETAMLVIHRVDSEVREVFSNAAPASDEDLLKEITPGLSPLSGHDNTRLDEVLLVVAQRASTCTGRCIVILSSDGFCEGMSPQAHADFRRAAQSLADNSHVVGVFVEGVDPINMTAMRADLAPLTSKLQFSSAGTLDTELVADLLQSGGVR